GRFVQYEYFGVVHQCPDERNQLRLSRGKGGTPFLDLIIIPARQPNDKFMGTYLLRCFDDLLTGNRGIVQADVIGYGVGKQENVLQYSRNGTTQVVELILAYVYAVQQNRSFIHFVKA